MRCLAKHRKRYLALLFDKLIALSAGATFKLDVTTKGNARLRAGLPANWQTGDKSGTGRGRAPPINVMIWRLYMRCVKIRLLLQLSLIALNIRKNRGAA